MELPYFTQYPLPTGSPMQKNLPENPKTRQELSAVKAYADFLSFQRNSEAAKYYALALRNCEAAASDQLLPLLADICHAYGIFLQTGDRAEALLLKALTIREQLAKTCPDGFLREAAEVCSSLALSCSRRQPEQAEAYALKALSIWDEQLKYNHDQYLTGYANACGILAAVFRDANRFEEAENYGKKALSLWETMEITGRFKPQLADANVLLGSLYQRQHRYAEAIPYYEKGYLLLDRLSDEDPSFLPPTVPVCYHLGQCYEKCRRDSDAETNYLYALSVRQDMPKTCTLQPTALILRKKLGKFYRRQREPQKQYRCKIVLSDSFGIPQGSTKSFAQTERNCI